ncbi:hypothetical protein HYZ99_03755 [Candidatus Peregrinibacteria bacterium]|nr:hypothetical protein [Candidatus Peregrinibacteria bacterium]
MQYSVFLFGLLWALLLASPGVYAKHFPFPTKPPGSFEEVKEMVQNTIPDELAKAQCGGWDLAQSVSDKIPQVSGVPGRKGNPLGNVTSGMAQRVEKGGLLGDGFEFPTTTKGLATACDPETRRINKKVWNDNGQSNSGLPGGFETKTFAYPYFKDPPCLWRNEKEPKRDPEFEEYNGKEKEIEPPHNQQKCIEFCQWLNQWKYRDCARVEAQYAVINNATVLIGYTCAQWKDRYLCTDHFVGSTDPCVPGQTAQEMDNATGCKGADCRCPGPGCRTSPIAKYTFVRRSGTEERDHPGSITHNFESYFRAYEGSYARAKVKTDNKSGSQSRDVNSASKIPIACYGIYDEFDPKTKRTGMQDRRCVIELDVTKRPETQKGKGTWGEKTKAKDEELIKRDQTFDASKDLWYENLGGGISFLSEKVFHDTYNKDLSTALLSVDTAKIRVTKTTTGSTALRAFDDTVSNERGDERTVVEWWQTFQTDAHKLFSPPIVRLFVPPTWSFGIDHLDPIYQGTISQGQTSSSTRNDPRMEAIEVQVHAREDLLGQIASFLERSLLLKIEEEPIPIVVPLGSPTEFRAYAQAWQTAINERSKPDGTPLSGQTATVRKMKAYMKELEKYAEQAEAVRTLRAELPRYIGSVAEAQNQIVREIAEWMEKNLTAYKTFLESRAQRLALQKKWIDVQQAYVNFHDKTNMPWCRNDRFTTSIYSLLDPWMPPTESRGAVRKLALSASFPQITVPQTEPDLIFDFSNLRITAGTAVIPVLKPTLVRVRVMLPRPGMKEADVPKPPFPSFPPIPSIYKEITKQIAKLNVSLRPAVVTPPKAIDLAGPTQALEAAHTLIKNMDQQYKKFWESLPRRSDPDWEPPTCATEDGDKDLKALECCGWNQTQCMHVEMDLMERLTRIGARPAVLLKEDFESHAEGKIASSSTSSRRSSSSSTSASAVSSARKKCDPKDEVCLTLHPENRKQADGWQIQFPQASSTSSDAIAALRDTVRHVTLTETGGLYGKYLPYGVNAEQLYPTFGVPPRISLSPASGSGSISTSAP